MRIISYFFLFALIGLGVTFAILNPTTVTVNYYVGHHTLSLSLLLVFMFAAGGMLGLLIGLFLLLKAKIKNYRLKQRLKLAEKEIENLRAIPLHDGH